MGKLKIDFEINDLEFICNYLIVVFWIFKSNNNPYFNLVEVLSEIIYENVYTISKWYRKYD